MQNKAERRTGGNRRLLCIVPSVSGREYTLTQKRFYGFAKTLSAINILEYSRLKLRARIGPGWKLLVTFLCYSLLLTLAPPGSGKRLADAQSTATLAFSQSPSATRTPPLTCLPCSIIWGSATARAWASALAETSSCTWPSSLRIAFKLWFWSARLLTFPRKHVPSRINIPTAVAQPTPQVLKGREP